MDRNARQPVRRHPGGVAGAARADDCARGQAPGRPLRHGHFITLELPTDEIVVQRINVPAQAREFLAGIVRNRIDRLSPWPADQVVYGSTRPRVQAMPTRSIPAC